MQTVKNVLNYLQSIEISQIVDLIIALVVVILVLLISPFIAYVVLRLFYKKENKQEIKNVTLYKSIRTFTNLTGVYVGSKILILTEVQDAFIDKIYRIVIIWTVANLISGALELNEIVIDNSAFEDVGTRLLIKDNAITEWEQHHEGYGNKIIGIKIIYSPNTFSTNTLYSCQAR